MAWLWLFATGLATGLAIGLCLNDGKDNDTMLNIPDPQDLSDLVRAELEHLGLLKPPRAHRWGVWASVTVLVALGVGVATVVRSVTFPPRGLGQ